MTNEEIKQRAENKYAEMIAILKNSSDREINKGASIVMIYIGYVLGYTREKITNDITEAKCGIIMKGR